MTATAQKTLLEFYFMRHAKTVANEHRLANGSQGIDTPLATSAREDLHKTNAFFRQIADEVSIVVHTDMLRSLKSAEHITLGESTPLLLSSNFNEQGLGDWEGIQYDKAAENYKTGEDPPNGETNQNFLSRVKQGLISLSDDDQSDDKIPFVVSHGGVWLGINKICGIESHEWPDNNEVFRARLTGDWENPELEYEQVFTI